jgi:hypothetical protein
MSCFRFSLMCCICFHFLISLLAAVSKDAGTKSSQIVLDKQTVKKFGIHDWLWLIAFFFPRFIIRFMAFIQSYFMVHSVGDSLCNACWNNDLEKSLSLLQGHEAPFIINHYNDRGMPAWQDHSFLFYFLFYFFYILYYYYLWLRLMYFFFF